MVFSNIEFGHIWTLVLMRVETTINAIRNEVENVIKTASLSKDCQE